jgi:fumarate hydratase subunit alpha
MIVIEPEDLARGVKETVVRAATTFRPDQTAAFQRAVAQETNPQGRWVLEQILENASLARAGGTVLCDDSGVPHLYVEVGEMTVLDGVALDAIHRGVAEGLRAMPGRPMAVKGEPYARLEQSQGLYEDPGTLVPGPMILDRVPDGLLRITVLMQGGGPELRGRTGIIHQRRSTETFFGKVIEWATEEIGKLGCTPCVAAVGVGRSHVEAGMNVIRAMARGDLGRQDTWERRITEALNATGTGPLGLGADISALGTFICIGPLRASGFRSVSVRLGCCFEPRRATLHLNRDGSLEIE